VVIEAAGGGTDGVQSSVDYTLVANVETLALMGTANLNGTGNGLANVLVGNVGDNRLDGRAGADTMTGGLGNDTYVIDNAGDVVTEKGGGGIDTVLASIAHALHANVENLVLTGTAALNGTGNAGANALTGNGGRNVLDGGLGADVLAGGGGGDTFRFSTALGAANVDRIVLFNHTGDTIQLDDAVFAALGTGGLAAGAFNLGAVASQADDRILFDAASKSLYYDADGLDAAAAVRFATIDTLQGVLDHTDFLIV
jgi:Ca2+-binding RTX toxin-like protein